MRYCTTADFYFVSCLTPFHYRSVTRRFYSCPIVALAAQRNFERNRGIKTVKTKYLVSCAIAALVSGSTFAAAADSSGIEEVVVTAERRSQSVEEVPTTVQAFSGQTLSDLNVKDFSD